MGLFKDAIKTLPYAAMVAGAISLVSYSAYTIREDKAIEEESEDINEYNHDNFPELYENYQEYISNIAKCIGKYNEDRIALKDFAFYLTMLDNGYISYGREFERGKLPIEFDDALGATIATGTGVCRHGADNFADVMCELGYDAKVVVGKAYKKGEERPDGVNHAVVFVRENGIDYLFDPLNGTIFLKKSGLVYYEIKSQEGDGFCFEPTLADNELNDSETNNLELLLNMGDFNNHWDILKELNGYLDEARQYKTYFFLDEITELLENESNIKVIFDDIINEYSQVTSEQESTQITR